MCLHLPVESWETLAAVGERLTEVDPLGEDSGLMAARAHLELGDEQAAAQELDRTEAAPVHVEGLQVRPSETETTVQGRVAGNLAEPGTSVRLLFTFYGADGPLGTEILTVTALRGSTREVRSLLRWASCFRSTCSARARPVGNEQPDDSVILVEQENLAIRSWSETQVGS